jgi:hypothetical protein
MTGAVSANLCCSALGFYQDSNNKNGVDWLRFCQTPTCSKVLFKIHTLPIWPIGLLLGGDNIILQKLALYNRQKDHKPFRIFEYQSLAPRAVPSKEISCIAYRILV